MTRQLFYGPVRKTFVKPLQIRDFLIAISFQKNNNELANASVPNRRTELSLFGKAGKEWRVKRGSRRIFKIFHCWNALWRNEITRLDEKALYFSSKNSVILFDKKINFKKTNVTRINWGLIDQQLFLNSSCDKCFISPWKNWISLCIIVCALSKTTHFTYLIIFRKINKGHMHSFLFYNSAIGQRK